MSTSASASKSISGNAADPELDAKLEQARAVVVGINRGLSPEERAQIPPYIDNIRLITEYVDDVPSMPDEIKQEMNDSKNSETKEGEESSEEEEEGDEETGEK